MKTRACLIALLGLMVSAPAAHAALEIDLAPAAANPVNPRMGDQLRFRSVIKNSGTEPVSGLIAWISLIRVDPGQEQPVDLEDWSAQKAIARGTLGPGEQLTSDWPMRLIQSGDYRVVISVVGRNTSGVTTSPFVGFTVRQKAVVELARIVPVAIGVPLLIVGLFAWRRVRTRGVWRPGRHEAGVAAAP